MSNGKIFTNVFQWLNLGNETMPRLSGSLATAMITVTVAECGTAHPKGERSSRWKYRMEITIGISRVETPTPKSRDTTAPWENGSRMMADRY
jgi:hypothetical protein